MDNFKDVWSLRQPGKRDSLRHKKRIKDAIKQNLKDLVAEENIISSKGGKKIKVPMKYLDMWRFKFGKNKKAVGQGEGDPGDIIYREYVDDDGGPGNEEGEDLFEEEVDIQEVIEMMLEDLQLPWLEQKEKLREVETEETVFNDIAEKGLPSNVDKKRTIFQNIKRNAMCGKPKIDKLSQNDLRYKIWENVVEKHSNASVIMVMDRSGSMTSEKKYIARSFFFWMVNFLKLKYNTVEMVFIAHDTTAKEVPEEGFFTISESGGTACSSGFKLALDIIKARFPKDTWNNYVFSFSDGDNWDDDNSKCITIVKELLQECQAIGYGEIDFEEEDFYNWAGGQSIWSGLHHAFGADSELVENKRFMTAAIAKREDVYECLQQFLTIGG